MPICSLTTGSSRNRRRCHCCRRRARPAARGGGRRAAGRRATSRTPTAAGSAPWPGRARRPARTRPTTQPSWRTRNAVTSSGEWMRARRIAEVLADAEQAGDLLADALRERADDLAGSVSTESSPLGAPGAMPPGRVGPEPLGQRAAGEPARWSTAAAWRPTHRTSPDEDERARVIASNTRSSSGIRMIDPAHTQQTTTMADGRRRRRAARRAGGRRRGRCRPTCRRRPCRAGR